MDTDIRIEESSDSEDPEYDENMQSNYGPPAMNVNDHNYVNPAERSNWPTASSLPPNRAVTQEMAASRDEEGAFSMPMPNSDEDVSWNNVSEIGQSNYGPPAMNVNDHNHVNPAERSNWPTASSLPPTRAFIQEMTASQDEEGACSMPMPNSDDNVALNNVSEIGTYILDVLLTMFNVACRWLKIPAVAKLHRPVDNEVSVLPSEVVRSAIRPQAAQYVNNPSETRPKVPQPVHNSPGNAHVNCPLFTMNRPFQDSASPTGTSFQRHLANMGARDQMYLENPHPNTEIDRLATFSHWPDGIAQIRPGSSVHVNANGVSTLNGPLRNAASSGTPRQWRLANIISSDHRRYLTNLHLNGEIDRLATFSRWPITRPNVAPVDVAMAGFFYLGDMDRTQCFSCGGVLRNWTRDDNAMNRHRTHFGNCRFVLGTDNRNVPVPMLPETQAQMTASYPCQHPTNPHMRSEQTRLATFDSRWPSVRTRATPEQIAKAGFFYLGVRDRVKCWYCNGGLQNWEYDDMPWVEHAKWFPSCQFLLRNKGQHFVYRHLSVSPHLPRPVIGRQEGATIDPVEPGQQRGQHILPPISRARAPTPPPNITDPQEEMRRCKEVVDKEICENVGVRTVIDMGFDEEVVRKVLEERLKYLMSAEDQMDHIRTKIFDNTEQLLNAVVGREAEIRRELEEEREATRLKEIQQSQEPMSFAYPSVSPNYNTFASTMKTEPSMASQAFGANNVPGFLVDSDEERDIHESMPQGATAAAASTTVPTSMSEIQSYRIDILEDPASLKDMIERMKEKWQCKICFAEAANMVFMPCSHMCCCKNCTKAVKHCPVCRKKINRAIIVYPE